MLPHVDSLCYYLPGILIVIHMQKEKQIIKLQINVIDCAFIKICIDKIIIGAFIAHCNREVKSVIITVLLCISVPLFSALQLQTYTQSEQGSCFHRPRGGYGLLDTNIMIK